MEDLDTGKAAPKKRYHESGTAVAEPGEAGADTQG